MNIKTNGEYNKIQINFSQDRGADGSIIKKSLMINIREDEVEKACELYRALLSKVGEGAESSGSIATQVQTQLNSTPKCPLCGSIMVMRTNSLKGTKFWGCSAYYAKSKCRGVRQYQETLPAEELISVQ